MIILVLVLLFFQMIYGSLSPPGVGRPPYAGPREVLPGGISMDHRSHDHSSSTNKPLPHSRVSRHREKLPGSVSFNPNPNKTVPFGPFEVSPQIAQKLNVSIGAYKNRSLIPQWVVPEDVKHRYQTAKEDN